MLRDSEILQSSGYLVEAKLKFVKWSIDRKVDAMEYVPTSLRGTVKPRIILHGGAGNITRSNLPPASQEAYKFALTYILLHASSLLNDGASALTVATAAVSLLEDNPLFNCGRGAVFTGAGTIELEASVMVSRGYKKRGAAVSLLKHVKHPILFVKEMLERGEEDLEPDAAWEEDEEEDGGAAAKGHVHVSGPEAEWLASEWGLEMVQERYFWTRKRWEEHKRGLKQKRRRRNSGVEEHQGTEWAELFEDDAERAEEPGWDGEEYLPQGTVGCVVLDNQGILCVATSTGGLTNKLPGRIGDTPTFGAGFWAEEGLLRKPTDNALSEPLRLGSQWQWLSPTIQSLGEILPLRSCLPGLTGYSPLTPDPVRHRTSSSNRSLEKGRSSSNANTHAIALSGTGNGDTFLRLSACRTASALSLPPLIHFPPPSRSQVLSGLAPPTPTTLSLPLALKLVAGPGGLLQQSAGDRWRRGTFEGEGGIIGIEFKSYIDEHGREGKEISQGNVTWAFNCGGMFRAWVDEKGEANVRIFQDED